MKNKPIGVFDSGLGGLTVVKALKEILPNESILYFGDTARLPYGVKSRDLIIQYSMQIANFLIKNDAKMIIVACNTATAMALEVLKNNFKGTPIIGVIEPGAIQASLDSKSKKIGIIGTVATINSKAYDIALGLVVLNRYRGLTEGATHYHATYVNPSWSKNFFLVGRIGEHIFYRK